VTGHGVLDEMSIVELHERLARQKQIFAEEEEERRQEIVKKKQAQEQDMMERVHRLSEVRTQAEKDAYSRRVKVEEQKAELVVKKHAIRLKQMDEMHSKIEAKRAERRAEEEALAAERKAIKIKRQFLAADASAVEEKKWDSQLAGAERALKAKQTRAISEDKEKKQVLNALDKQRKITAAKVVKEKKAYQQDFDDRLAVDALDTVLQHKDATMLKQTVHEHATQAKAFQRETTRIAYPYTTRINATIKSKVDKNRQTQAASKKALGSNSLLRKGDTLNQQTRFAENTLDPDEPRRLERAVEPIGAM
jgi:hypothetical protein